MLFAAKNQESDRREFPRVRYAEPVGIENPVPLVIEGGLSCDLSVGGLRLNVSDFIPAGTELTVQIRLNNGRVEDCRARVAWVEKQRFSDRYYIGLRFLPQDSTVLTQRHIHRFVDSLQNL